jgi:hypothetical protein
MGHGTLSSILEFGGKKVFIKGFNYGHSRKKGNFSGFLGSGF